MAELPWLAPLILSAIVIGGYVLNRNTVLNVARGLRNLRVFSESSPESALGTKSSIPIADGECLQGDGLREAVAQLARYAEDLKPDWILGVHPGGLFLSVVVSHMIGLDSNRCLYVSTFPSRNKNFAFEPSYIQRANRLDGSMLVIDDISRTGDTLQHLRCVLKDLNFNKNFHLSKISFAVLLVVASQMRGVALRFRPDWVCLRTENRNFRLPWTGFSAQLELAFANRESGHIHDMHMIADYERIVRDFDYALEVANTYFPLDTVPIVGFPRRAVG